jgi:myo-inositol-1(or 4)-monophosphatase
VGHTSDLERINAALDAALVVLDDFTPGRIAARRKEGGDPVTEADELVDAEMRRILPRSGEGWLSEESVDDKERLGRKRVWIVDPIDGTREFVEGIPEWCVSIGLIEDGLPVAGGIHNPATGERITGTVDDGLVYNGPNPVSGMTSLEGARVGASRSEMRRGEWERFEGGPFHVVPMGSVAYKLSLVAAGRLDATWTLVPKNEWDLAAGVALLRAAGGWAVLKDGSTPTWNKENPLVPGFIATTAALRDDVEKLLLG